MVRLYLGTHEPSWLAKAGMPPLFVSVNRLAGRKTLPRAAGRYALDSGGFTELSQHGHWRTTAEQYLTRLQRVHDEVGPMDWAAPQDWMCEPWIVAKTGLTVAEHQRLTVENYVELRTLAPQFPVVPVLQGWSLSDYLHCVDLYSRAGVDLRTERVVGVGSVCRRQATGEITTIVATLADHGIPLHGFGVKTLGLRRYGDYLTSADSLAWSYNARRRAGEERMPGCTHRSCANCPRYALAWHARLQRELDCMPPTLWSLEAAS